MAASPRSILTLVMATAAAAVGGCDGGLGPVSGGGLAAGTWGGDNAGLIVADSVAHVHVGCTFGNFRLPVTFDRGGRFEAPGDYLLRAYPVAVGPTMPARFEGTRRGDELTFIVTVNDTVAKQTVVLGPATVVLGREPRLGPCPICRAVPALELVGSTAAARSARFALQFYISS
jgi:hypothetical protein